MHQPQLNVVTQFPNRAFQSQRFSPRKTHVNMVGWTPSLEPPKFLKDDKNVSSRKTLESVNARPCQHCRSGKHWDYECKYSRKGEWQARANYVSLSDPDTEALNAYNDLYYLTGTSRLNLRTSLAWRGIRKRSQYPLPNLQKLSMWLCRNKHCI